jgi:bifunctional ADP-heptose synthase (sugar kinase/adenylyltransferase)
MTKKGPLSKAEKFYIKSKHEESNLEDLCKELDRAKSLVRTHITKCKKEETKKVANDIGSQFASNDNGATVMTPNASEMADAMRGKKGDSNRQNKCITSIRRVNK